MSETMNDVTMTDVTMTDKLTNNDMASNVTGPASSGSEGRSANPSVAMPRVVSIVGPTASGKTEIVRRAIRDKIINIRKRFAGMPVETHIDV